MKKSKLVKHQSTDELTYSIFCSLTCLTCSLHRLDINAFWPASCSCYSIFRSLSLYPPILLTVNYIKLHLLAVAVQPVLLTFQCIPLTDRPLLLSIQSFLLLWSKVLLVVHLLTSEILLYLPVGLSCSLYNISSSLYSLSYSLYILRSNGNDIEAKQNEASILRHFLCRSETNKLILKL